MQMFIIQENEVTLEDECILNKKYHVIETSSGTIWFASDLLQECEDYIAFHGDN